MTAPDWQAEYERERAARLDAEARLRGMRWVIAMALVALAVIVALAGCQSAVNSASRAVARWEVSSER